MRFVLGTRSEVRPASGQEVATAGLERRGELWFYSVEAQAIEAGGEVDQT